MKLSEIPLRRFKVEQGGSVLRSVEIKPEQRTKSAVSVAARLSSRLAGLFFTTWPILTIGHLEKPMARSGLA